MESETERKKRYCSCNPVMVEKMLKGESVNLRHSVRKRWRIVGEKLVSVSVSVSDSVW